MILLRKLISLVLGQFFAFSKNILFTLFMFVGEIFAGLIIYYYQKSFSKKNQSHKNLKKNLIFNDYEKKLSAPKIKIYFLIFVIGFFDFIEYILSTNYIPKFPNSSGSLGIILGGITTIITALFFYYLLKMPILRHQFFSIYIIGLCFIVTILLEYYFQDIDIFTNYGDLS